MHQSTPENVRNLQNPPQPPRRRSKRKPRLIPIYESQCVGYDDYVTVQIGWREVAETNSATKEI